MNVLCKQDGMLVSELADCLNKLVAEGKGSYPVFERRQDEPMRYVDVHDGSIDGYQGTVTISEAY